jgi:hypothetical protein
LRYAKLAAAQVGPFGDSSTALTLRQLEFVLDETANMRLRRNVAHAANLADYARYTRRLGGEQATANTLTVLEYRDVQFAAAGAHPRMKNR